MTLVHGSDTTSSAGAAVESAHIVKLRGRDEILQLQELLIEFSASCDQLGAMNYLEYFLTSLDNIKKIPHLILITRQADMNISHLKPQDLMGVALVYEYTLAGVPMGLFSTSDFDGIRAVIAQPGSRACIAAMACRYLMDQGARVALFTCEAKPEEQYSRYLESATAAAPVFDWATRTREVGATIVLAPTFDETLAAMGKHTRRNLRYYRRKTEAELNCTFVDDVRLTLTRAQFYELNRASTHPVSDALLESRLRTMASIEGSFCVGVRRENGEWVSMLGGRRYHGVVAIDWQINRGELDKYSIGTVIRAYLIESEISMGSKQLFFEGGTPHSMKNAFVSTQVIDLVAIRRSPSGRLLRRSARWPILQSNFLFQPLAEQGLLWTPA